MQKNFFTDKSRALFKEAVTLFPGGVNSPVRAFRSVEGDPIFFSHGSGAHLYDVDGNEYLDYVGSWGPAILGHAHHEVISSMKEMAQKGVGFGAPTEIESRLAQAIIEAIPSIEMIRFVNSGTEATMSAVRLARSVTKRDKVVKFEGCYHGHADYMLIRAGSGATTIGVPDSPGVPADFTRHTVLLPFNDTSAFMDFFDRYGEEIACVIMEPAPGNMGLIIPDDEFLQEIREATRDCGSILIFDEVMSGFRVIYGGVQDSFCIVPDITCLGKVIGGGLPVGAFGGSADIMKETAPSGPTYQAGTMSGNPVTMAAGLKTLEILKKANPYRQLNSLSTSLVNGLEKQAGSWGIDVKVNRLGSMFCAFFAEKEVRDYKGALTCNTERFAVYHEEMLKRGIYLPPSQFETNFLSTAHTEKDIEYTVNAAAKAFDKIESSKLEVRSRK